MDDDAPTAAERPRVVLVTGEPGSGKTTLGVALAHALRVPFLARDDVRGGLFLTAGAWSDEPRRVPTPDASVEAFVHVVETMAALGVSCVVEHVIRRERPEALDRLIAAADCVVVETWCHDPIDRYARRVRADRLLNRQPVLDALGLATIEEHTAVGVERMRSVAGAMMTDFDLPHLRVRTDDGDDPGLDDIVAFVTTGT